MKINEILFESPTDLVAHLHKNNDREQDDILNPQANLVAGTNREYYKKYFKEFFRYGKTPVFTDTENCIANDDDDEWTNKPDEDEIQSAGYRGQQSALARAGVPHDDDVQSYDPSAFMYDISRGQSDF